MNPIQIPTDNLYKFIAISGLILIVIGLLGTGYIYYNTKKDVIYNELFWTAEKHSQEQTSKGLKLLQARNKKHLKIIDSLLKTVNNENFKDLPNKEKEDITRQIRHLEAKSNAVESEANQLLQKDNNYDKKVNQHIKNLPITLSLKNEMILLLILFPLITCVGVFISIIGFFMWYYKVQRYLDIKLKNEVEIKQRKKKRIRYI